MSHSDSVVRTHEAFGLLQIHRIQGCPGHLFGSSVDHHSYIELRVAQAEHHRDLNHDWYHDTGRPLIEIRLSAAQFAEAITTLNYGAGTPCTIGSIQGKTIPLPPAEEEVREVFQAEFKKDMSRVAHQLDKDIEQIRELLEKKSLSKEDRKTILFAMDKVRSHFANNAPFVHQQFEEAVEKTLAHAKAEADAFLTNAVIRAGQQALVEKTTETQLLVDKSS